MKRVLVVPLLIVTVLGCNTNQPTDTEPVPLVLKNQDGSMRELESDKPVMLYKGATGGRELPHRDVSGEQD